MNYEKKNPFYSNYIFTIKDLKRKRINFWQYPLLWFLPTYIQLSAGYENHFKLWQGKIYLLKMKKISFKE